MTQTIRETRGEPTTRNETVTTKIIRGTVSRNSHQNRNSMKVSDINFADIDESEVIMHKPVFKEVIVEKPYIVIVEKRVKNIIEKDVITEKIIEIPIERIIEQEVEVIEEIETLITREKEVYYERMSNRPIERIVEKNVDRVINNEVEREMFVDVEVERRIARPHKTEYVQNGNTNTQYRQNGNINTNMQYAGDTIEETVVEKIVEVPYTTYIDVNVDEYRQVNVDKKVEKIIYNNIYVDKPVEQIEYITEEQEEIVHQKVNRPVNVENIVYEDVITKVPKIVKKSVQKVVEKEYIVQKEDIVEILEYKDRLVEVIKEVNVPVEKIVEVEKQVNEIEEVQNHQTITTEVTMEHEVDVPIYRRVAKYVEIPIEKTVDVIVEKNVDVFVEEEVPMIVKVDKRVPVTRYKDVFVEVPVERTVEKIFEIEITKQVPVYRDKFVEKKVEKIIEKRVYVPQRKYVEVPFEKYVDVKFETEVIVENPIYIDNPNETGDDQEFQSRLRKSARNDELRRSHTLNVSKVKELQQKKSELQDNLTHATSLKAVRTPNSETIDTVIGKQENDQLREEINVLHKELSNLMENSQRVQIEKDVKESISRTARSRQLPKNEVNEVMNEKIDPTVTHTTYINNEKQPKLYQFKGRGNMNNSQSSGFRRSIGQFNDSNQFYRGSNGHMIDSKQFNRHPNQVHQPSEQVTENQDHLASEPNRAVRVSRTRVSASPIQKTQERSSSSFYTIDKDGNKQYLNNDHQQKLVQNNPDFLNLY